METKKINFENSSSSKLKFFFDLIKSFIQSKISAVDFAKQFFVLHQNDYRFSSDEISNIINKMFYYVEAYCEYTELRDENDLDEKQLLNAIEPLFNKLKNL